MISPAEGILATVVLAFCGWTAVELRRLRDTNTTQATQVTEGLNQLALQVKGLSGTVESINREISVRVEAAEKVHDDLKQTDDDHEERLRELERDRARPRRRH